MAYARFYHGDWYLWWDVKSGNTINTQLLAIAHVKDVVGEHITWPRYYTYRQLKDDLEGCLLTYRLHVPKGTNFRKLRKYIQEFIEDVEEKYGKQL